MRRANPDLLRSCLCIQVFRLSFSSDFINLLLAKFHQAEIIIVKHLIQGRNNETRLGVEALILRSWSSQKRRSEPLRHAADYHHLSSPDMGKLRLAGQIQPADPFILARRHLHKLKLPPWIERKPFFPLEIIDSSSDVARGGHWCPPVYRKLCFKSSLIFSTFSFTANFCAI